MKEKLQKIIDNHCKQFGEISEDQFPTPTELWREMMKSLGCYFYNLYMADRKTGMPLDPEVEVAQRHGLSSGQYIFLHDPCSVTQPRPISQGPKRPARRRGNACVYPPVRSTILVPNDIALKILSLGLP